MTLYRVLMERMLMPQRRLGLKIVSKTKVTQTRAITQCIYVTVLSFPKNLQTCGYNGLLVDSYSKRQ